MKYLCWADDGSQTVQDATEYEAPLARYAAEACAEREHSESAGENHYPLHVHVSGPDGKEEIFQVEIEHTVSFTARRI